MAMTWISIITCCEHCAVTTTDHESYVNAVYAGKAIQDQSQESESQGAEK